MKLNLKVAQKTISSGDLAVSKMDVDAESADILTYYLRDKIYSDKILAPVREYICNATDAHGEFDIDKEVEVSMSMENGVLMWKCRDYGIGMDDDDIRNVFGKYGKSSKRDSEKQIGGFGVGALSGFSYTDTFYVISHHNGVKTSYVCTLGSGNFGVSVGEIYEVGQEPTDEQGIEISFEVEEKDRYSFNSATVRLVSGFTPDTKLKYTYSGPGSEVLGVPDVITPLTPKNTVKVGDYVINNYENFIYATGYGQYFMIRMGGVVYPYTYGRRFKAARPTYPIVVDVPIGKLTIPISRESIEDLPQNQKVFSEIEDLLEGVGKDEVAHLSTPKFGAVVSKNEDFNQDYMGEWFRYPYSSAFPETYLAYYKVQRCDGMQGGYSLSSNKAVSIGDNKKYNIYIFPDIKSLSSWHLRLNLHLKEEAATNSKTYDGYLWMRFNSYEETMKVIDPSIDISDCNFIDVKTMGLQPLAKVIKDAKAANVHYMVYSNVYNKNQPSGGYYTAAELNKAVIDKAYAGKTPNKNWHEKVTNLSDLHIRVVGNRKGHCYDHIQVNSIAMIDALKKLGWLTRDCQAYKDAVNRINDIARHENTIRNIEYRSKFLIFSTPINARTLAAIKANPAKLDRIEKLKQEIVKEDSVRGRILRNFCSDYSRNLSRVDVRGIMRLK